MSEEQRATPPLPGFANSSSALEPLRPNRFGLRGSSAEEELAHPGGSGVDSLNKISTSSIAISNKFEGGDVYESAHLQQNTNNKVETSNHHNSFATLLTSNSDHELEGNIVQEQRTLLNPEGDNPLSYDDELLLADDDNDNVNLRSLMLSTSNSDPFEQLPGQMAVVPQLPPLPPLPPSTMQVVSTETTTTSREPNDEDKTLQELGQVLEETGFCQGYEPVSSNDSASQQTGLGSVASTENNQAPRTVTNRYHSSGRGSYNCNLCGKPRKGHTCQFITLDPARCYDARVGMLAAVLSGVMPKAPRQSNQRLQVNPIVIKKLLAYLQLMIGTEKEQSDTTSEDNSTSHEPRTKSNRYHNKGRGTQRCNACGLPRKKHLCIFERPLIPDTEDSFVGEMLSHALAVGLRFREMFDDNDGQDSIEGNEDTEENARDEDTTEDRKKAKRQRKH
jgi:hypothetical protein